MKVVGKPGDLDHERYVTGSTLTLWIHTAKTLAKNFAIPCVFTFEERRAAFSRFPEFDNK